MTGKSKIILTITTVFVAGVITGICTGAFFAHKRVASFKKMNMDERRSLMMEKVFSRLDLTADQEQQISVLIESVQQMSGSFRGHGKELHKAQKVLIEADEFDEEAYRANLQKMAQIKEDIAVEQAHVKRKIRALLNESQREQMDKYFGKIQSFLGPGGGKGHYKNQKRKHFSQIKGD